MKLIKISLIVLVSASLIFLGACRNPFKFNKHDGDNKNSNPAPKNEENNKDKKKHSEGSSPQQQKPVITLITLNSSSIAS